MEPRRVDARRAASPNVTAHVRPADVVEERVEVAARDGFALGAMLHRPVRMVTPANVVVLNAGGGLSTLRYRHFAQFVASRGAAVLAYDYRGVGLSRPRRLRGFVAGLDDWAELDHPGALDFAATRFPGAIIAGIAHSVGAVVAVAAPGASRIARGVLIGPHTGYWRDYRAPWRWPMRIGWHVAMPAIARSVGYFPGRALRLGDDFPLRFALQWAQRTTPEFRLERVHGSPERGVHLRANARALHGRALVVTMYDDAFVGERAVQRFLALVPGLDVTRHAVERDATGGRPIGHFGFFSRRHAALWPIVTRYLGLDGASVRTSPALERA